MATTLVITNDFPPRIGGIENFVLAACESLDGDVVVLTRRVPGFESFDARLGFRVVRVRGPLLPTRRVARQAVRLLRQTGATRVIFGAAAPLGLLAPALRRAGASRLLALSHGHEVWWAKFPPTRLLLRRIARGVDVLSTISDHTAGILARKLGRAADGRLYRLAPPVDGTRFAPAEFAGRAGDPAADAAEPTRGGELPAGPVCVAAGRFVRQKGFDTLVAAWPEVRRQIPDARLLIAGSGGRGPRLRRLARTVPGVSFVGPVGHDEMPEFLRRGRVFALPVRSLLGGWYAEGLGTVFLEAAAAGLPLIVGDSGGAPETVRPGLTGVVVDPEDPAAVAAAIVGMLKDSAGAQKLGRAGREFVLAHFGLPAFRRRLRAALLLP